MPLEKRQALIANAMCEAEALQRNPGTGRSVPVEAMPRAALQMARMLPRMVPTSNAQTGVHDDRTALSSAKTMAARSGAQQSAHDSAEASTSGRGFPRDPPQGPPGWRSTSSLKNLVGMDGLSTEGPTINPPAQGTLLGNKVGEVASREEISQLQIGFTSQRYSGIRLMTPVAATARSAPLSEADLADVLVDSWQPCSLSESDAVSRAATRSASDSSGKDVGGAMVDGDGAGMQALVGEEEEFSVGSGESLCKPN